MIKQQVNRRMAPVSHRSRALKFHQDGDAKAAFTEYALHLAATPNDFTMWSNLGALYRSEKQYEHAVSAHRRALQGPRTAQILGNASNALFDGGYPAEAVDLRRDLLLLEPDVPMHHAMLGKYMRGMGDYHGAIKALDTGIAAHADFAELHIQRALALLALGEYPAGFAAFDWRWLGDEISKPKVTMPQWRGEDVAGKRVVVFPEQGFGDTVLMARFLKGLGDLGAHVIFACKSPLSRSLADCAGITQQVSLADLTKVDADYWTPMMDLPLYLNTTLDTLPAPVTLTIPKDSRDRAERLTRPYDKHLKIGVLWSGSLTFRANHKRSFDHTRFLQLAQIPDVQLFSLYKGPVHDAFVADGTHALIVDAAGTDRDFADSAALIQSLDLVITMDSAIAHVAGSLGGPVWNLLHSEAYWLYEPFKDHTPWYPNMRLVRQAKSGDWASVFDRLEADVRDFIKTRNIT